jgi:hypothetical protein
VAELPYEPLGDSPVDSARRATDPRATCWRQGNATTEIATASGLSRQTVLRLRGDMSSGLGCSDGKADLRRALFLGLLDRAKPIDKYRGFQCPHISISNFASPACIRRAMISRRLLGPGCWCPGSRRSGAPARENPVELRASRRGLVSQSLGRNAKLAGIGCENELAHKEILLQGNDHFMLEALQLVLMKGNLIMPRLRNAACVAVFLYPRDTRSGAD